MSVLFSKIKIGTLELENRVVVPPMCQYSANFGLASDWHKMHYGSMAVAHPGLIIVEATAVELEGRISYGDLGIWDEERARGLGDLVSYLRLHSKTPLALQLAHAGRKGSYVRGWEPYKHIAPDDAKGWQTVAPSALPLSAGGTVPRALSLEETKEMAGKFAKAAKKAKGVGFDAVEIHAAHGYLLHQYLSPITNKREDEYGGSLENRMRLVLEVFEKIKAQVGDFPVGIRISAMDWIDGGWDLEDSIILSKEMEKRGCAYIHVSGGGLDGGLQKLPQLGSGYQLPYAEAIKKEVKIPVIGVGLITEAKEAEKAIKEGRADLIAIGRAMLFDPRWTWRAAAELGAKVKVAPPYHRAEPYELRGLFIKD